MSQPDSRVQAAQVRHTHSETLLKMLKLGLEARKKPAETWVCLYVGTVFATTEAGQLPGKRG